MNYAEQDEYLNRLLGEQDDQSDDPSDSEDEDWFPTITLTKILAMFEASDNEDGVNDKAQINGGTQEEEEDDDDERDAEEESDKEVDSAVLASTSTTFVPKDKTVWSKTPPQNQQTPARNIVRQRARPHKGKEMLSISGTFKKFITLEMVDIIVRCTNKKAEAEYQKKSSVL